ncbi:MAG: acetate kinase [Syntrophales bacterium]
MKILIINCGSSSIKYLLYDEEFRTLAKGLVARIGETNSYLNHQARGEDLRIQLPVHSHRDGFNLIVRYFLDKNHGVLEDISEILAVGHRAVHGGDFFIESVLIDEHVIDKLEEYIPLAPLHNPPNIAGIREAMQILPNIPHVAVFDTAFHQTMPKKSHLYALPYKYYETGKIRRYGFHGTSCRFVCQKTASLLGMSLERLKMIICHLGNGVSIAAVSGGKSIDTSMGFTPLEGLIMGTRCGNIDAGVIFFLHRQLGLSIDSIDNLLNKESGLLGISGISNDLREITEKAELADERCQLALEMFAYSIKKYIGAYSAALGGLDALVFTAGIGENSSIMRTMICEGMEFWGIELDEKRNSEVVGIQGTISKPGSKISVLVVPTNEEHMIALDTVRVAGLSSKIYHVSFQNNNDCKSNY